MRLLMADGRFLFTSAEIEFRGGWEQQQRGLSDVD
jgi:hypothetical protein